MFVLLEVHMSEEKLKDYFIVRYSLIPDTQIDIDTAIGISKESKFLNWLSSFNTDGRKETTHYGTNYALYCKPLSENCFFMSFAKELHEIIGEKTEDGIKEKPINNYKKCNIFIHTLNQWMIIEKNLDIASDIEHQKNNIATIIGKFLKPQNLYFELGIMTEENNFWKYVIENQGSLTDIDITFSSPNFLRGINTVNELLHETNDTYNNTSIGIHLKNDDGRLNIDERNPFLQDAIKYSSSGCGKWKIKSKTAKSHSSIDNPFIIQLPEDIGQLKASDYPVIEAMFNQVLDLDTESRKE